MDQHLTTGDGIILDGGRKVSTPQKQGGGTNDGWMRALQLAII